MNTVVLGWTNITCRSTHLVITDKCIFFKLKKGIYDWIFFLYMYQYCRFRRYVYINSKYMPCVRLPQSCHYYVATCKWVSKVHIKYKESRVLWQCLFLTFVRKLTIKFVLFLISIRHLITVTVNYRYILKIQARCN